MKIGIIESGNIGDTLGKLWAQAGHEVLFSNYLKTLSVMKDGATQLFSRNTSPDFNALIPQLRSASIHARFRHWGQVWG